MNYRPRLSDLLDREEPDEPGYHDLALPYQAAIWLGIWFAAIVMVLLSAVVLKVLLWAMS